MYNNKQDSVAAELGPIRRRNTQELTSITKALKHTEQCLGWERHFFRNTSKMFVL